MSAGESIEAFRVEARAWLEANCPPEMRQPSRGEGDIVWGGRQQKLTARQRLWLDRMAARGWTTPDWPSEFGGGGLSPAETKALREEMAKLGCRLPLFSFGISMLGPALLKYGTEVQKREHLPRIVRGEIRWCQGYSEPGAGSDLAGLQTFAEDRGDHFVVTARKSGRATPTRPTGSSALCAPTARRSRAASPSSCLTWRRRASRRGRSSSSQAPRRSARLSSTM